ncbi:hypothetical protein ACLKA6_014769 [Drosophila palustris]
MGIHQQHYKHQRQLQQIACHVACYEEMLLVESLSPMGQTVNGHGQMLGPDVDAFVGLASREVRESLGKTCHLHS